MTDTKVIKLKLEGDSSERLPNLMGDTTTLRALNIFSQSDREEEPLAAYNKYQEQTKDLNVSSRQLNEIIKSLEETFPPNEDIRNTRYFGLLTSALINNSKEKKFRIKSRFPMDFVGYKLDGGKELTVDCEVGDGTGMYMKSGKILVNGHAMDDTGALMEGGYIEIRQGALSDVGNGMKGGKIKVIGDAYVGAGREMEGGEIIVEGNADSHTAWRMRKGHIVITGNVTDFTGERMRGGLLEVDGSIQALGDVKGGEIRRKGETYWKKE
ncbi:MAG: hypothetical protein V1921_06570 [Candidatus Altiarchaeota archaeon]